ncbi:MAG: hypothetical protein N3G78_04610 [Desulfobacterota bacterium]|nr:hypothetical protein [Thermodesulfobacteriota bacterium]
MLFCKKCGIEQEEDKRFCPQCGSFLIKKEGLFQDSDPQGEVGERPKEKFICPECHIIYEKTKACIRCGIEVLPFSSYQERRGHPETQAPRVEKKTEKPSPPLEPDEQRLPHLICPTCRKEHLGGSSCIRCGGELVPIDSPPQDPKKEKVKPPPSPPPKKSEEKRSAPSGIKGNLLQEEEAQANFHKRTLEEQLRKGRLLRKVRRDYPRTILNWGGMAIIAIAVGYFLWSTYAHLKESRGGSPPGVAVKEASTNPASSDTSPSSSPGREKEEEGEIKSLLENIRLANLRRDIDLFMSCYGKDFKDREGKRRSTLNSWEKYTFLHLEYDLSDLSISGDRAKGRVQWRLKFAPKGGGPPQESRTTLETIFLKEEGRWKIGEIKSES